MSDGDRSGGSQDLVVRIWGMAEGHAFFQNAYARNLKEHGALLSGIEHPLQAEDIIGVQYADKKARFRVLEAKDVGLPQRIQAEVELLDGQECPWKDRAKDALAHATAAPTQGPGSNKRRFPRFKIQFPIELRDERGGAHMQTAASDVSGRGCYVESRVPLPLGTNLSIVFWMDAEKVSTTGMVRASDPGVGMGIEFVGLDLTAEQYLQAFFEKLAADSGTQTPAT